MTTRKLESLLLALAKANEDVRREMQRLWPVGKAIWVKLQFDQKIPSGATVIGHPGGECGYVTVRVESPTRPVRDVSYRQIVEGE